MQIKKYCCLLLFISAIFACSNKQAKEVEVSTKTFMVDADTTVVDTILLTAKDTAFVIQPKLKKGGMERDDKNFEINVLFSEQKWPTLNVKHATAAALYLTDDLDGDDNPELLLRSQWFSGCWSSINLFSLKDDTWKLIKKGSMYHCADNYPLAKRIEEKDNKYYLLTDSVADEKFVVNRKEIKF